MRVAVVGASGLVGNAVVEYLAERNVDFRPLVGSTGNSWRLMSQGYEPSVANVLDRGQVRRGLAGCTHVVNCLRSSDRVMFDGLANLLAVAREQRVERFVHLSSVAVYGDPPPPEAVDESAPARPARGSYGAIKLKQDHMVQAAARRGLSAIVLCPPNITGPGSYFLLQVLGALLRRHLPLVDDGNRFCSVVDARNFAHACHCALTAGAGKGERLFVTDAEPITWRDIVNAVGKAGRLSCAPPAISEDSLRRLTASATAGQRLSIVRAIKHLVSSDVRQALRGDPLLARIDMAIRASVAALGSRTEETLRLSIEGPLRVQPARSVGGELDVRLASQQLRNVRHSSRQAAQAIGYAPIVTFERSMQAFATWLRTVRGMDRSDWDLRRELFGYEAGSPDPTSIGVGNGPTNLE